MPKSSHVNEANTDPTTTACFFASHEVSPKRARYPIKPPANVSPAPVGSTTFSKGIAGLKNVFPSSNIIAPCSPFFITTVLGPILWTAAAAKGRALRPVSCRTSSSLIIRTSTLEITFIKLSIAISIQKFIVSRTTKSGRVEIWSKTDI